MVFSDARLDEYSSTRVPSSHQPGLMNRAHPHPCLLAQEQHIRQRQLQWRRLPTCQDRLGWCRLRAKHLANFKSRPRKSRTTHCDSRTRFEKGCVPPGSMRTHHESSHFTEGLAGWAPGCRIAPSLSPSRHGPGCGAYMVLQCAQLPEPALWVQPLSGHDKIRRATGFTVSRALLFLTRTSSGRDTGSLNSYFWTEQGRQCLSPSTQHDGLRPQLVPRRWFSKRLRHHGPSCHRNYSLDRCKQTSNYVTCSPSPPSI